MNQPPIWKRRWNAVVEGCAFLGPAMASGIIADHTDWMPEVIFYSVGGLIFSLMSLLALISAAMMRE